MMSRTQWYVFSTVRLCALAVLVYSVGNWIDRLRLSSLEAALMEFLTVSVAIAIANSWFMWYDTYAAEEEVKRRK